MHLMLLALTLQLQTTSAAPPAPLRALRAVAADSVRDARRARSAQASFERMRRAYLPWDPAGEGRCEVRVGRFCWWSDDGNQMLPPESESVVKRRAALIALFDSVAARHPGDDWIAGMAVHYRLEAGDPVGADSRARACRGTGWWCAALAGYSAHDRGDAAAADSAFAAALAAMPEEQRCEWTDIHTLLPGDARGRYEKLSCPARAAADARYWSLSRPRLAATGNDWHSEFLARRVQGWLAQRSLTPQALSWGNDAEELLLRYGWPVRWSRVERSPATLTPEISVVGHDPWPSFDFGPREAVLDSLSPGTDDDGWDLHSRPSAARYAPHQIERILRLNTQLARFRRGDSTLLVAAFFVNDDSMRAPVARLAAVLSDGITQAGAPDSALRGTATLLLARDPLLAGVEITDSISRTLARSRTLYAPRPTSGSALSDLLLYGGGDDPPASLDSALVRASSSERAERGKPVGVYWEAYSSGDVSDSANVSISVERIDHGFFRSTFQRLGVAAEDSPLRMSWTDSRPVIDGVRTYAISFDLAKLSPGRYRILVVVRGSVGAPMSASRELELTDR